MRDEGSYMIPHCSRILGIWIVIILVLPRGNHVTRPSIKRSSIELPVYVGGHVLWPIVNEPHYSLYVIVNLCQLSLRKRRLCWHLPRPRCITKVGPGTSPSNPIIGVPGKSGYTCFVRPFNSIS